MCICDRSNGSALADRRRVSVHCFLFPCIDDRSSVRLIHRKVFDLVFPVIGSIQSYAIAGSNAIRKKFHFDSCRAHAVLVVGIVPGLLNGRFCLFRREIIGVCDRCVCCSVCCISSRVAGRNYLFPGINDLGSVRILGKACYLSRPVLGCLQFHRSCGCSVDKEIYRDLIRALAELVIGIDPFFSDLQIDSLRCTSICDRCLCSGRSIIRYCVSGRSSDFFPRIFVFVSVYIILRQICLGSSPKTGRCQSDRLTIRHIVLQELNLHRSRTFAVLVVIVIPCLRDLRRCSFNGKVIAIRDRCDKACRINSAAHRVSCRNGFFPSVCDRFSAFVDRKIVLCVLPGIT